MFLFKKLSYALLFDIFEVSTFACSLSLVISANPSGKGLIGTLLAVLTSSPIADFQILSPWCILHLSLKRSNSLETLKAAKSWIALATISSASNPVL